MPSIIRNVMRRPYSSRMRSLSPLPVTAPMRAHISWTTISATVMGIMVHKSMWPNCAPAAEYVKMPPASLSTFAVMKPGPTTAKNSRIRFFQRLRNLIRAVHGRLEMNDQNKWGLAYLTRLNDAKEDCSCRVSFEVGEESLQELQSDPPSVVLCRCSNFDDLQP